VNGVYVFSRLPGSATGQAIGVPLRHHERFGYFRHVPEMFLDPLPVQTQLLPHEPREPFSIGEERQIMDIHLK
jgi:hypothetical protein